MSTPTKTMSPEGLEHLFHLTETNASLPLKITELKEHTEVYQKGVERRHEADLDVYQYEIDTIVNLKLALDNLYGRWGEKNKIIRWIDIPKTAGVTVEDIIQECIYSTESIFSNTDIETLAVYLETCGYDNLVQKLASRCLQETRDFISLPFKGDDLKKIHNHTGANAPEKLRTYVHNKFTKDNKQINIDTALAIGAHVEYELKFIIKSIELSGFSFCEANCKDFGRKISTEDSEAIDALLSAERWKAEILLEILKEYSNPISN